jgi:glycosyltransferase involved in cell wall biosynthesis
VGSGTSDISVVIPYYNRERYMDEAVQSVLAQTLKPLEIIIVNDCSREASRRFLDRYAGVCTIIDLPVNVGLAASRNAGIFAARGQFIALLDDDDIWLPSKLELQHKYMEEHPECAGVHTAVWAMFPRHIDRGRPAKWLCFGPGPMTLAQALTNDYWVIPSTMMFRTEVVRSLGGFDPHFRQCEDRDFIIRFCAAGYRIEGIGEPLARLRREGHDSLTARCWHIFFTDLKMCWKHKAFYFRAYGLGGFVNFVLEKIQAPSSRTRYVDGAVRLLLRFVKVKYRIRAGYREPVGNERPVVSVSQWPVDKTKLVRGQPL